MGPDAARVLAVAIGVGAAGAGDALTISLERVSWVSSPDGAEITAFDPRSSRLFTAGDTGVSVFDLAADGTITPAGRIDLSGTFDQVLGVSSVAVDPRRRGFGVATVIPADNTRRRGAAVIFSTTTKSVLTVLHTGFHPDMVCFALDGDAALIADEGEATDTSDAHGGVTYLDLSTVSSAFDLADARAVSVTFHEFLGSGGALDGVRPCPVDEPDPAHWLEPEYIAPDAHGAWISLQENNALARFDFASMRFTEVRALGSIEQRIDASDRDGAASIDDRVHGLLMPDSIASYEAGGRRFLITVNEGDPRGEEIRFADAATSGLLDAAYLASLDAYYDGNASDDAALGRLQISSVDGDLDGDGDIDRVFMYGARSFSIWDAETGTMVFDSGSDFERVTAEIDAASFNAESDPASFDGRSDNRGPEPEGVALANIEGRTVAFIGLERADGVVAYDVTVPEASAFLGWFRSIGQPGSGVAPEGLCVVERGNAVYLVVSSETSRTIEVFRVMWSMAESSDAGIDSER